MDTITETFRLGYDMSHIVPVPHDPASTRYVPAGPVTLGLEYRSLDENTLVDTVDESGNVVVKMMQMVTSGLSVHVFDTATMGERLRFDDLDDDPHYHYLDPGKRNVLVVYDPSANGDMMAWTFGALRRNLRSMLEFADAAELAAQLDDTQLEDGISAVEALVAERRSTAP
ncbi:MAG: hypothetical protein JWR83_3592 [Aeromicrobium sp.]|jgi:hypothetical protein|nr:hypothetical protein [Aeromicrobium sp.]